MGRAGQMCRGRPSVSQAQHRSIVASRDEGVHGREVVGEYGDVTRADRGLIDRPGRVHEAIDGHNAARRELARASQNLVCGDRDVQIHVRSMTVRQPPSLRGATVVILDDTATTGHSVDAARQLITQAGTKRVAAVALGRTVKYL